MNEKILASLASGAIGAFVAVLLLRPDVFSSANAYVAVPVVVVSFAAAAAAILGLGDRNVARHEAGQGLTSGPDDLVDKIVASVDSSWAEPSLDVPAWITKNKIGVLDGEPDRRACESALAAQLGKRWTGAAEASPHLRAVAVLCGLHADGVSEAAALRRAVGAAFFDNLGRLDFAHPDRVLYEHWHSAQLLAAADKAAAGHAYATGAIAAIVIWARTVGGPLAASDFLWVKAIDRGLWYVINDAGRAAFHVESSGAIAHFRAETESGRANGKPQIAKAYAAVRERVAAGA